MSEPNPDYVHEKVQGIDVVTFCDLAPIDSEQFARIKQSLCDLVDSGVDRLVLDSSNIEHIPHRFVEILLVVRNILSVRTPFQEVRPSAIFRIVNDRERALDVISSSTSNPLILCSLCPELLTVLTTIGLCDDSD